MFYVGETFDTATNASFDTIKKATTAAKKDETLSVFDEGGTVLYPEPVQGAGHPSTGTPPDEPIGTVRVICNKKVRLRSTPEVRDDNVVGTVGYGAELLALEWENGFVTLAIGGYILADGALVELDTERRELK